MRKFKARKADMMERQKFISMKKASNGERERGGGRGRNSFNSNGFLAVGLSGS